MKDNILIYGPNVTPKSGTVRQLIVFLHGWGSNGDDLIQLSPFFSNELACLNNLEYLFLFTLRILSLLLPEF